MANQRRKKLNTSHIYFIFLYLLSLVVVKKLLYASKIVINLRDAMK